MGVPAAALSCFPFADSQGEAVQEKMQKEVTKMTSSLLVYMSLKVRHIVVLRKHIRTEAFLMENALFF
jgi:hypothetical protein